MKENEKKNQTRSGDIFREPGIFQNVELFDEESLHPTVIGDLTEEQKAKEMEKLRFVLEVNAYIDAVKSGKIEGEYGEF